MPSFKTLAAQRAAPAAETITRVEIPAGGPAVLLASANSRRRALALSCDSGTVFFGYSPAVDAGTGQALGAFYEWPPGAAPGNAVYAYAATATSVLVREASDPAAF